MYKIHLYKKILTLIIVLSSYAGINAQSSIQLLDENTHASIIGMTFHYGEEMGVSGIDGTIQLDYKEGSNLMLSHLMYGEITMNDSKVIEAIENGLIYMKERINNIQPITVLALRGKKGVTEGMEMDNISRLNHDAGAILANNEAISVIKKSGAYGFDPVLRGFKYDRLNIVINGSQCASAACPNRMDPPTSQISLNMMEDIEIIKGPYSLRYGASFGGTINFKKAKMKFAKQHKLFGRVSNNYESNGGVYRGEGMIGLRNEKIEASVFGSWSQGNDYTDGAGVLVPAEFNRGSVGAEFGFRITGSQTLQLSATRNFASDVVFASLPMDLRSDDTWMFNGTHDVYFEGETLRTWNTTFYGTKVDHVMDNLGKNLNPRKLNAETAAFTRNYGGRTEGIWNFGDKKMYVGADYRLEKTEGNRVRDMLLGPAAGKTFVDNVWQKSSLSKLAVFGEYHLPISSFNLIVSARMEMNDAKTIDPTDEFVGLYPEHTSSQLNPSVSVGGSYLMDNGWVTGLWLGRAQRSAGISERYINFLAIGQDPYELLGNPLLDPEANNQVDFKVGYRGKKSVVDFNVFAAYLTDYISAEIRTDLSPKLPNSPGVRQFVNIGEARLFGFEFMWSQVLWKHIHHKLSVAYTNGENLILNEPLPEIAPLDLSYAVSGSFLNDKLDAEVVFRHVLGQERVSTAYKEGTTPSFSLINMRVGYQFGKYFHVSTGVNNLLDTAYYEHLSRVVKGAEKRPLFAPGRNIYVALAITF